MKIAFRLLLAATLAVLVYGMATAAHRDHPWFILGPTAVLAVMAGVRYREPS